MHTTYHKNYICTGNASKVAIAHHALGSYGIAVENVAQDVDEVQSEDLHRIALVNRAAYKLLGVPLVVSDDSPVI